MGVLWGSAYPASVAWLSRLQHLPTVLPIDYQTCFWHRQLFLHPWLPGSVLRPVDCELPR
jgi:hypothetical protein